MPKRKPKFAQSKSEGITADRINPKTRSSSGNAAAEQMFPTNDANKLLDTDGAGNGDWREGTNRHIR